MRILQVGNICGIPQALAQEQRRRGQEADHIAFPENYSISNRARKFLTLCKRIPTCDVMHFHYSTGLPLGVDLVIWKLLGKTIVMHYHGSDIRGKGTPVLARLLASKIYVSTPDLLQWAPGATWQPHAVDLSALSYQEKPERDGCNPISG